MTDPAVLSATELLQLYRTKQLSPVEAARAVLERIERFDPAVNAFCLVDPDQALAAARASEARWQRGEPCGLLDGVPATIKDLILTRGWPTLRGSLTTVREQPWDEDAPATARLREQGAVLIGKTTTPEFGWKAVTDSALTGITRNPWNTDTTPGGSSGGAAVACALGMGALARRHRRRRLDPDPGGLHRHLRAEAELRTGAGLAAQPVRHGRPPGADDPDRGRCGLDAERAAPGPTAATGSRCPTIAGTTGSGSRTGSRG